MRTIKLHIKLEELQPYHLLAIPELTTRLMGSFPEVSIYPDRHPQRTGEFDLVAHYRNPKTDAGATTVAVFDPGTKTYSYSYQTYFRGL